jgi:MFS family permease
MEPWWSEAFSNTLGGTVGATIGVVFGGIGGGVGGPLAGSGRAKTFVLGMFWTGAVVGLALVAASVVAAILGQPFHVWQWMLICGVVLASVNAVVLPQLHRAYRRAEERRLAAAELRRS